MTTRNAARVLIVDDEESVLLLLQHVLSGMGCEVATAADATEGSRRIRAEPPLDLVLLDKNLPDRSGLDLLAEAKGHDPDLEIVMITGYASLDAAVTALRFGAGDFLTKPFDDLPVLTGKLENAIERARRARERTCLIADLKQRETSLEAEVAARTTELESAMKALEHRDEERRRLMANVGHDLRTPLTTIQGYLEMLMKDDLPGDRRQSYVRIILGQCRRLTRLTRDLTFLARQADGQIEWRIGTLSTEELVCAAVEELSPLFEQIEVKVSSRIGEGAREVPGDRDRLMQVLTNILGNAAKFAPERSEVKIEVEADEAAILFSVSDAGMGVPEEKRSAVFERYHTRDAAGRGEGIGLSISRDIVMGHGGRIWVEDSDEGGASFRFMLPNAAGEDAA